MTSKRQKTTTNEECIIHSRFTTLPSISVATTNAESFYEQFVHKRRPVKFTDHITDSAWKGSLWSNEYLRQKSGDATVRVEHRDSVNESFGQGKEMTMTFGSFLDSLQDVGEDTAYYLTTQELTYSSEGQPSLTSAPVDGLLDDFPFRPLIMGHLLPQNMNLWFGSSRQPTTSGLHHDFHDNLYILLRGEKRITLFSPEERNAMYTHGEIVRVHPNGRINYQGQLTNADGSDAASLLALQATAALNAATLLLEEDEEEGEKQIEDALEALLDAERAGDDNDDDDEEEDYDDDDDDENEECAIESALASIKETTSGSSTANRPANFSRIDTTSSSEHLRGHFPLYYDLITRPTNGNSNITSSSSSGSSSSSSGSSSSSSGSSSSSSSIRGDDDGKMTKTGKRSSKDDDQCHCYEVTVKAGEMLYIPAGWFHEVRSVGGGTQGHMAFNYWFHPPDGDSFEKPYSTDFWVKDWESRGLK